MRRNDFPLTSELVKSPSTTGLGVWAARSARENSFWIETQSVPGQTQKIRFVLSTDGRVKGEAIVEVPTTDEHFSQLSALRSSQRASFADLNGVLSASFSGPLYSESIFPLSDDRDEVLDRLGRLLVLGSMAAEKAAPVVLMDPTAVEEVVRFLDSETQAKTALTQVLAWQRRLHGISDVSLHRFEELGVQHGLIVNGNVVGLSPLDLLSSGGGLS